MTDFLEQFRAALADRYGIERELGRGGMATVYLAQDLRHKRRVALKVLDSELAHALGFERFRREIETSAELQHPHVLPVFDSGEAAGQLWYTMPYVRGESLRDRLGREGRLPIPEALRLAREIAEALDYAHRHGIVHRDIKPGNILLSEGHALVADFGIARHGARVAAGVLESATGPTMTDAAVPGFATGATLTGTGISLGTPAYMSPEQALATRDADGRTDQYALGCVLYEMLAGAPPYSGRSAQAVIGQHITADIPDVRAARPEVPAVVAGAVAKAMAKVPEARFTTAAEFAVALEDVTPAPAARRLLRRRVLIGMVPLLAAAGIGVGALLRWSGSPASLDEHLIAVAPFDVQVPELAVWREGMVDYFSRSLDGAGSLRAVPPTVALRRWRGRADLAAATAFGHRTGAGLVVYGQLLRIGRDSVRVVATLVDARRGTTITRAQGADLAQYIDRAVDAAAVDILRHAASTQRVGRAAPGRLSSRSPAALRAFLGGEQFYRRGMWDSATARYKEAIEADTNFTLAYWHLGRVIGWHGGEDPTPFLFRAAAHTSGLAPRDSVLITADSIMAALQTSPVPSGFGPGSRLLPMLNDATNRYPSDPEVWYELGEARYHWGATLGEAAGALGPFERAIALDSLFVPAYVHAVELKLSEGDAAGALRYFDRMRALGADLAQGTTARAQRYLLGAAVNGAPLDEDSVTGEDLRSALELFARWPDTGATTVSIARALVRKGQDIVLASHALAFRGHAAEAVRAAGANLASFGKDLPVVMELALIGAAPAERVEQALRAVGGTPEIDPGNLITVRWWGVRRDTVALRRLIARLRRGGLDTTMWGGVDDMTLKTVTLDASAYLALARHDTTSALRAFMTLTDSLGTGYNVDHLQRARLHAATGDLGTAVEQYRAVLQGNGPISVVARLELAELAERQGARELALESYQFVAAIWKHADSVLRPYVARAQAGLARLASEPGPDSPSGDRQQP